MFRILDVRADDHAGPPVEVQGSAWAMAGQMGEGYVLVSDRTWAQLDRGDLERLAFELDKLLRETGSVQPPLDGPTGSDALRPYG